MKRIADVVPIIFLFGIVVCGNVIAGTDDLMFIHHSCGENWLNDGLRTALEMKSYIDEVNEITYGTTFLPDTGRPASLGSVPGDNTNMNHWILWFNDYLQRIKSYGCANGSNKIIMFKSCYPISCIYADGTEPGNPFSEDQELLNYQAVYRHPFGAHSTYTYNARTYKPLEQIFAENPDILFIPVTAPSNIPNETCTDWADRARVFNNWLKNDWLSSYNAAHPTLKNVAVFDWFDILTYPNNYTGTELYTPANGDTTGVYPVRNMTKPAYRTEDSHPNTVANQTTTIIFATSPSNFIDAAYHNWKFGIPTYLNSFGAFSSASDTTHWFFERYGDGSAAGILTWVGSFSGQTGVLKLTQTPGQKGKITQVVNVNNTGWFTAIAKVATDVATLSKQQKVYLYLQQLDINTTVTATGNLVVASGAGALSPSSTWRNLKISFYASTTFLGIQLVSINPANSGVTSSLYIDDIWVYAGADLPTGTVPLSNSSFDSGTIGWLIEPYGDAVSAGSWTGWSNLLLGIQSGGEKGKLTQMFSITSAGRNMTASVKVLSGATTAGNTQKIYLYIYSHDSGYNKIMESGNAISQPGKWIPSVWYQLQFGLVPLTRYNAVQVVGVNPTGRPYQALYFDDIQVKSD
ncbi:MAG: hypothetical protein N3A72_03950 [bacterium]|nr:hypothetical protein [bacterium]